MRTASNSSLTQLLAFVLTLWLSFGWPPAASAQEPFPPEHPLAFFARMMGGEWEMKLASGNSIFRNWHWGPGQHSLRVMNEGKGGGGEPWLDFDVIYWHPGQKQIRVFGVSQYERGITDGVATVDGDHATVEFDLYQTGRHRRLRSELEFKGRDMHHAQLLEASRTAPEGYKSLAEWDLVRQNPPEVPRRIEAGDSKAPSELLRPLLPLINHWEARLNAATGSSFHVQATVEWIPRADAIYIRVVSPRSGGGWNHLLDAYLYHHTGSGRLRFLTLSSTGGVFEGDIVVDDHGAMQMDFDGFEGDRSVPGSVAINFMGGAVLQLQAWLGEGADRKLVYDLKTGLRGTILDPRVEAKGTTANPANQAPATGAIVTETSKAIQHVFQARNGDYWFCSGDQGAYRYDGKALVNYTTRDGLPSNSVGRILEDAAGNLYLPTGEGISKFDGQTFTTLAVAPDADPDDWKLQANDLWFGGPGDSGLVFRCDGQWLYPLQFPATTLGDEHLSQSPRWRFPNAIYNPYDVYWIVKDSRGHVWFCGTCVGVGRYDGKSFQWLTERVLTSAPVRAFFQDSHGDYWISGSGAGSVGNGRPVEGFDALQTGARGTLIDGMSIVADGEGKLWTANYRAGATRIDPAGPVDYPIRDGETVVEVFTVYKDRQGTIWLGTHNGGAWLFDGKEFQRFRTVW